MKTTVALAFLLGAVGCGDVGEIADDSEPQAVYARHATNVDAKKYPNCSGPTGTCYQCCGDKYPDAPTGACEAECAHGDSVTLVSTAGAGTTRAAQ